MRIESSDSFLAVTFSVAYGDRLADTLPDPLVPAEVDLRDFAFMPLDVRRLRDSSLITERAAEEIVAAVLLWSACWHQVPASSLPDDDKQLCQLAGYGRAVREFVRVRDGAMHRFIKCSDGRWYHPVVAEKAADGWNGKLKEEHKRACDRARKANKEKPDAQVPMPSYPQLLSVRLIAGIPCWRYWDSIGTAAHSSGPPPDSSGTAPPVLRKSRLKGEGEGEGELRKALDSTSPTRSSQGQKLLKNFGNSPPSGRSPDEAREIARKLATGEVKVGGR